jgi:type I restriction enzyme R subunit
MTFQKEADFEEALIKVLADKGWEKEVIKNPTEQDLIRNWAKILYDNNRGIDRLNNYPLTDGEMQQIILKKSAIPADAQSITICVAKEEG